MKIKFAKDIIKDIEARGEITIPKGFVIGEDFEKWMYGNDDEQEVLMDTPNFEIECLENYNEFYENLGEAA